MGQERESPDLTQYNPLKEETRFIPISTPKREFTLGRSTNWTFSLTPRGVFIFNIVHKDHPDALCQVQCLHDEKGKRHFFFQQLSPTEDYIPEEVAEETFDYIWNEIEIRTPRSA
jgi:hypothetical protein